MRSRLLVPVVRVVALATLLAAGPRAWPAPSAAPPLKTVGFLVLPGVWLPRRVPGDQDRFATMFPGVKLQRGVVFVHDGKAVTSVGGARSYDPAMYLVERLYGEDARARIGEGLVLDWSRAAVKHRVAPGARLP
jgi:hypothetical protein